MALPAYGAELIASARLESAYDTLVAPAAASHGFAADTFEINPEQEWHRLREHSGSASTTGFVKGKSRGTWSERHYVKPRTAGTPPDGGAILEAAFGARSGSTFTLASVTNSLALHRFVGSSFQDSAHGACVEQIEVEATGNAEPMITCSGSFARYGHFKGTPVLNGALLTGATQFTVAAPAHAYKIRPGVLVAFAGDTNSGAGYLVTTVSTDGLTYGFTPALAGAGVADASTVVAHTPSFAFAGAVQGGISCGLIIGGFAVDFISFKQTFRTGQHLFDKEATRDRPSRVCLGERSISGSAQFLMLDENVGYEAAAWNGTTRSLECRIGPDEANSRLRIVMPAALLRIAQIKLPDRDEVIYDLNYDVQRSSVNNDELSWIWS